MRQTFYIMLLTTAAAMIGGCGKKPVNAEGGDVPVIHAGHSEAPTPQQPDDPEPVRLELPAEGDTTSYAAAEPSEVNTLSDAAPQTAALRRARDDQQLLDLASLQPVGSAADISDEPSAPSLAEQLQAGPDSTDRPRLAPLPEPDIEPVSESTRTVEVARPVYDTPPAPMPQADEPIRMEPVTAPPTAEPVAEPATPPTAEPVAEPATPPAPPRRPRRLGWEPRPDPLTGLVPDADANAETNGETAEAASSPTPSDTVSTNEDANPPANAYDDGPAPRPLTSMITDDLLEASVVETDEPEDTGPTAPDAPPSDVVVVTRPPQPEEMFTEKVVAGVTLQVNQKHLTVDEVLAALHGELVEIPDHLSRPAFRREVERVIARQLMGLVQQILVAEEAEELLDDAVKKQIDVEMEDTMRNLLASAGGSRERLKAKIRQEGTTLDALLAAHRRNLLVRSYLRYKFVPAIVITRRMLWDYYRRHEDDYRTEKKVRMQIVALPFDAFLPKGMANPTDEERGAAKRAARRIAERAMERLQAGDDFALVAKNYSEGIKADDGGVWPLMGKGNFVETQVEAAAFELSEGDFSEIIETDKGFYIVRAHTVQPGKVVSFEDAQSDIRRAFQDEQLAELRGEHMRKIYQSATVSKPDQFIRLAVERAVEKYWR